MTSLSTPIDVAVGVLIQPDGRFLLGQRPAGKPYAGYWEFPGGKLETGEDVFTPLKRELHEELGLDIAHANPWVTRVFTYPHATVRLHFWRVTHWQGTPHGRENQAFDWFDLNHVSATPLLPATVPVLRWLALPPLLALSAAEHLGSAEFLRRLRLRVENETLPLLQLREKNLDAKNFAALFREVRAITRDSQTCLLVNSHHPREYWEQADGVHLTAADLATTQQRPDLPWVGASIHSTSELVQAADLGCDFAVLGSVNPTASHPDQKPLGWANWRALAAPCAVPVYAIGGLGASDLRVAQQHGAHGIAAITSAWD
ncbi:MAG: Nudix family hydrolase [Burkholderiaceae bacterium]|nr:MAG: Nudix family hydrolase [Burkholderiaceae bacterium]